MNQRYEAKFGHIFIICASGKSAQEMLAALKDRCESVPKSTKAFSKRDRLHLPEQLCTPGQTHNECAAGQLVSSTQCSLLLMWHRWCRLGNEPYAELPIAAAEQMKITELRLRKLLGERSTSTPTASWDGPIAAVTRRAGLLKAQLGAFNHRSHCAGLCG